jgi:hypothetical protein
VEASVAGARPASSRHLAGIWQASGRHLGQRALVVAKAALLVSKTDQGPPGPIWECGLDILKKLPFLPSNAAPGANYGRSLLHESCCHQMRLADYSSTVVVAAGCSLLTTHYSLLTSTTVPLWTEATAK